MNTFIVRIISEEKSTWQGQVEWVDGKQTQSFRSMLELIRLMATAIVQESENPLEELPEGEESAGAGI